MILRFELERELVSGRLAVADLPEAWNTRFQRAPRARGDRRPPGRPPGQPLVERVLRVLPDLPARKRPLGPGLGAAREAIPDVEERIERGDFSELHGWLRENLYALGSKFTPAETIERVVGGPIARRAVPRDTCAASSTPTRRREAAARLRRRGRSASRPERGRARPRPRGRAARPSSRARRAAAASSRRPRRRRARTRPRSPSTASASPLTLRTYWSAAAWTSSSVAGGSKLWSVLMFRHMAPSLARHVPWRPSCVRCMQFACILGMTMPKAIQIRDVPETCTRSCERGPRPPECRCRSTCAASSSTLARRPTLEEVIARAQARHGGRHAGGDRAHDSRAAGRRR